MKPHRASNLNRAWRCPPSIWRELQVPNEQSEDAAEGTYLHSLIGPAWRGEPMLDLTDEHAEIIKTCLEWMRSIYDGPWHFDVELPLLDFEKKPIFDRHITLDAMCINEANRRLIIIDFKMGRAEPDFDVDLDLQLLCYTVACRNIRGFTIDDWIQRVDVYRLHPRLGYAYSQSYNGDDKYWHTYEEKLKAIVAASTPVAIAIPGEAQCRYCRAKMICPEFQAWALPVPLEPKGIGISELAQVYCDYNERLNQATKMMDAIKKRLAEYSPEMLEVFGLRLKPGAKRREIENIAEALERMRASMGFEDFLSVCSVHIGKLETLFKNCMQLKGRDGQETFDRALDGLIKIRQSAPTLEKIKRGEPPNIQKPKSVEFVP